MFLGEGESRRVKTSIAVVPFHHPCLAFLFRFSKGVLLISRARSNSSNVKPGHYDKHLAITVSIPQVFKTGHMY